MSNTLISWANAILSRRNMGIRDAGVDLADGVILCSLVELLDPKARLKYKSAQKLKPLKLENIKAVIDYLSINGIVKFAVNVEEIYSGNLKSIHALLWTILAHYNITVPLSARGISKSPREALMMFVKTSISSAGHSVDTLRDFTISWQDGFYFCALVHACSPASIVAPSSLNRSNRIENLTLAFETASNVLSVPSILVPTEVATTKPDEINIMAYVSLFIEKLGAPGSRNSGPILRLKEPSPSPIRGQSPVPPPLPPRDPPKPVPAIVEPVDDDDDDGFGSDEELRVLTAQLALAESKLQQLEQCHDDPNGGKERIQSELMDLLEQLQNEQALLDEKIAKENSDDECVDDFDSLIPSVSVPESIPVPVPVPVATVPVFDGPKTRLIYTNGEYFGGVSTDGKTGFGVLTFHDGDRYEGEFSMDNFHGKGTYFYATGQSYDGYWSHGEKSGYGVAVLPGGDRYEGFFRSNKKHGTGKLVSASGDVQEGNWVDGVAVGHTRMMYANGDRYEGGILGDQKDGFGRYTFSSGDYYEGMWSKDTKHGRGKFHYMSGAFYDGEFHDDAMHGQGTYRFRSGDRYFGAFVNNAKHGRGTYTFASGNSVDGIWQNDVKV